MKKIIGYTLLGLILAAGTGFAYLFFREPESAAPADVRVAMTPEQIERGRYIFTLADCDGCHTPHDMTRQYFPVLEEQRGSGQEMREEDAPGVIVASNITPDRETGLGDWTDGEKIRAIREGIGRDGRALFPMMPYTLYRHMSDEDVQALVAYLNTLKPIRHALPQTEIAFPVSMLIKGEPRPVKKPVSAPPRSNAFAYGEYLVTIGVCEGCHTPFEKGSFDMSKRLAGGRRFKMAGYEVVSANLTPDRATGIGDWTLERFLQRFRVHRNVPVEQLRPLTKELFTIMPWRSLAQLTDEDLAAMYTYLQSRPPVTNKVITHPVESANR